MRFVIFLEITTIVPIVFFYLVEPGVVIDQQESLDPIDPIHQKSNFGFVEVNAIFLLQILGQV